MNRITYFTEDNERIGLYTRNATQGAEYELVLSFVDYYCNKFLRDNKVNNLAIFMEPRVVSGFPDVVFASYHPSILDRWTKERTELGVDDLKVLAHLLHIGKVIGQDLIDSLRLPEKHTLRSLEKLMDAKLVEYKNKSWYALKKSEAFSIRKLVSIEAKLNDIGKVTEQSLLNTWFVSQSYALINSSRPQNSTVKSFSKHGIGLYCTHKGFRKIVEAEKLPLPSSYQSILFNEWIGNSSFH